MNYAHYKLLWMVLADFENRQKCLLRNFHVANLFHTFLTFFLLVEQFALTGDVAAVAFGGNVFAEGFDGASRYDFGAYGGLDGYVELMSWYQVFEFLADVFAKLVGVALVDEAAHSVHRFAVEQDV